MLNRQIPVVNVERPFDIGELFFSTTDGKGIITSCNEVFLRVADFTPEEILRAPHNIIRHPEMPRCVFKLLWDYLLSNKPIGAYVKNRAKNGEYYWVFALAAPVQDGFLSIRLKPSSAVFEKIPGLYQVLLRHEEEFGPDWKSGMASSTQVLLKTIADLGFESYDDFMNKALRAELASRDQALQLIDTGWSEGRSEGQKALDEILGGLAELDKLQKELKTRELFLSGLGLTVNRISLNASVRASQVGEDPNGRALSAVSSEVSRVAVMIAEESTRLGKEIAALTELANRTSFNVSMAKLQRETISSFAKEQAACETHSTEQVLRYGQSIENLNRLLEDCIAKSQQETVSCVARLRDSLGVFQLVSSALEKILLTIQFSYVTGRALAARVEEGEKFSMLLSELVSLSERARQEILALNRAVDNVTTEASDWGRLARVISCDARP